MPRPRVGHEFADLATVVIACPNCGTRYQVPLRHDRRGRPRGAMRPVRQALARRWPTRPPPPADRCPTLLFTRRDEAALDRGLRGRGRGRGQRRAAPRRCRRRPRSARSPKSAPPSRPSPSGRRQRASIRRCSARRKRAFDKRQQRIGQPRLPWPACAAPRGSARCVAAGLASSSLGFALRTDLVRWFPALAGLYAAIGLPVNVVGLEFEDTQDPHQPPRRQAGDAASAPSIRSVASRDRAGAAGAGQPARCATAPPSTNGPSRRRPRRDGTGRACCDFRPRSTRRPTAPSPFA